MSSSLVWEPIERKKNELSTSTKFVLRKIWGEPLNITLTEDCMGMNLDHELVNDVQDLINALELGSIHLREEY